MLKATLAILKLKCVLLLFSRSTLGVGCVIVSHYPDLSFISWLTPARKVNAHFWCSYRELTPPGGYVKKCQQAFLAPLPGMACEQSYCADINLGFVLKI